MPDEPEALGTGIGPWLADYIPLLPSGARRAGAARVMAARVGEDPSVLVRRPLLTQLAALGVGGVASKLSDRPPIQKALIAALPILAVQTLRRHEIGNIQEAYDTQKRKRLRELDNLDELLGGSNGSSRLGAVGAYEAMKHRKYQDIGSLSEAGDALTMGSLGLGPIGVLASTPITSWIDHRSADRLQKQASDFYDQKSSPAIPLLLGAAAAGSAVHAMTLGHAVDQIHESEPLPRDQWAGLLGHVSGGHPVTISKPGLGNAFFSSPHSEGEIRANAIDALNDPYNREQLKGLPTAKAVSKLSDQIRTSGVMMTDPDLAVPSVMAHEGGHRAVSQEKGVPGFLQDNVYPYQKLILPLSSMGSMAAGLASGSTLKGLLAGTGIGLLGSAATIVPEAAASYKGLQALKTYNGGLLAADGDAKRQIATWATYAAANTLPSMLSGAVGGWISGHRKKQEEDPYVDAE
jgi:hypothetical protein